MATRNPSDRIRLDLPYPPSINHYWRRSGRRIHVSTEGIRYREAVCWRVMEEGRPSVAGRLAVEILVHPPDRRRRDIDNVQKALLDSLEHAHVYEDDAAIDRITVERCGIVAGGKVVVFIERIGA